MARKVLKLKKQFKTNWSIWSTRSTYSTRNTDSTGNTAIQEVSGVPGVHIVPGAQRVTGLPGVPGVPAVPAVHWSTWSPLISEPQVAGFCQSAALLARGGSVLALASCPACVDLREVKGQDSLTLHCLLITGPAHSPQRNNHFLNSRVYDV